ncbi:hypothetical protein ACH4UM_18835 [Streptomyces sp. NPDC020801]|uniref:hypothetical protein n=1 Tax=Streptomyces sp. NPDC020801 TaxID=3365093 RepID=UPI003792897B
MTDRPTASTITDQQLDDLYAQLAAFRQVARGYCPACGRGDAAPTVTDWENERERADQAEELLRIAHDTSNRSEAERARAVQRVERVEKERDGINRMYLTAMGDLGIAFNRLDNIRVLVRRVASTTAAGISDYDIGRHDLAQAVLDTLAQQPAPGTAATRATDIHVYLSTSCLHGEHDYCRSHTGLSGAKKPAQCKFCAAPCTCPCHQQQPAHDAGPSVREAATDDLTHWTQRQWAGGEAGE